MVIKGGSSAASSAAASSNGVKKDDMKIKDIHNASNMVKANKRFLAIIDQYKMYKEPQRIPSQEVLVSASNRGGQSPNVKCWHEELGVKIMDMGYRHPSSPARAPCVSVCV